MAIEKIELVELMVFDFDGVMTDNRVLIDQDGKELVFVNRADGLAVSELKKMGYKMLILSTEINPVVTARAEKLKLDVLQGIDDKKKALEQYCKEKIIDLKKVLYVGNDINDREVMEVVGIRVVPADAYPEVMEIADVILKTKGGYGVIRELYSLFYNG